MAYYSSPKQYENAMGIGFICSNKTKEVDYNGWLLFVSEVFVCSDLITYLQPNNLIIPKNA